MPEKNKVVKLEGVDYILKHQKGNGGSGTVWMAESDGKKYAIKFFIPKDATTDKVARFDNEISFCRSTKYRHIVSVVAEGEYKNMRCYAMPYYSRTLRQVINEENDTEVLIKYILKICKAIQYIHRRGIKHRDIKPENILIEGSNLVLADFGIAHFKDHGLTKKGDLLANRNYVAPEQKEKNNALNIGTGADIYALGLIINECFTKQNLAGSQFKLIVDSYPLLFELDSLVESMIRQSPTDRISIDSVQDQINFIYKRLKQNLADIRYYLEFDGPYEKLKSSIRREIYKRASEDILFGKYIFNTHSIDKLNRYNHNWHMEIGYSVDDFLFNLYVQEQIFLACKGKFEYESNVYRENNWHRTLDLSNNIKHKSLYKRLVDTLAKYDLRGHDGSMLDLKGAILKYFSSCADYHCEEILRKVGDIESRAEYDLTSAPIIWIVYKLKYHIRENMDVLLNGVNGLGGKFEFNFIEHIMIDWDRTQYYETIERDEELLDSNYLRKEKDVIDILYAFKQQWKINFSRINCDYYSIQFTTSRQFEKFREYALAHAKPYYIFEGDVLRIIDRPVFVGNMVELKFGIVFDIPHTLAQIVGMKEIHA